MINVHFKHREWSHDLLVIIQMSNQTGIQIAEQKNF